jgi:outer membrane protein assembly factor BamA
MGARRHQRAVAQTGGSLLRGGRCEKAIEDVLVSRSTDRHWALRHRMGDRLTAGSTELRMPFTSPLRVARTGVAVFADTGTTYGARSHLSDAHWDTSVGAGVFLTAPIVALRLDVAHGFDAGTRVHFGLGLSF